MAAAALDTCHIVQRLRAAGFDERHAETVTDVFVETRSTELGELATRTDLLAASTDLKAEIAETRAELRAEITKLRTELKAEIAEARTEVARLDHRITLPEQAMNARLEGPEQRMTIKLGLAMVAGIAAAATLARLL